MAADVIGSRSNEGNTTMLVGREVEQARLSELLDSVSTGPVVFLLEGMSGIGKSALWRESVVSARHRGYEVLETAPSEPDSVISFAGLGDLFERIPERVFDSLPEVQAQALKAALYLSDLTEGSQDLDVVPRAILRVLRQLSVAGPVLLAIDDEQWLDPATARVLGFALARLRDEPIGVLIARRSEAEGALSFELRQRLGGRGMQRILLEPLPIGAIKVLLETRLGRSISAPLLRRIDHWVGGNPLWALAVAVELETGHSSGERAGDMPIPSTLSDAIKLRLRHLDPRTDTALLAIAALSHPTLAMVQAAIPEFGLSDLESAKQAGVIEIAGDRLRFTHPLLASTHYASTPAPKRRELHRRLATVIEEEEERAQHLALGAEAPDGALAGILEAAAGVAARRGAPESAAQLLEDAARLTPIGQSDARGARIVAAAEHRFTSGEVSRARDMLAELLPHLARGPLRGRARLQLALISADEPRVSVELLEAALSDAENDARLRIQIEWELTFAASAVGRLADARAFAESALKTAERLGDLEVVARALAEYLLTFVTTGEPLPEAVLDRLSSMDDIAAWTTFYQPATAIAQALYGAGDFEAARPGLEQALRQARSRGEEWDRVVLERIMAEVEWELGNLQLAQQHHRAAQEGLGEFAEILIHQVALDAKFALGNGDLTGARSKVEQGLELAERSGAALHTNRFIALLAWVELLAGHPEKAHAHLHEQRQWLRSIGYGSAGYSKAYFWSLDLDALIALGKLDEAEDLLAELRVRAEACKSENLRALAARAEGMLLTARGDFSAAIDAMDTAVAAHLRCPRPLEYGVTLLEKGSIERRAKRKSAAKQTLEEAVEILEPLAAEIWLARARDELSRIGLRRARVSEGLTPAQERVAELVVAGLANGEIARELHMSLRTVESHLTRVYQENGVRSRTQLIAALAASGGGTGQI